MLRMIGTSVKAARLKVDMTQECLAEIIGVHWQTISNVENGKFPFSILIFVRISQALQMSANRLLENLPEADEKQMERIKRAFAKKRKPRQTR